MTSIRSKLLLLFLTLLFVSSTVAITLTETFSELEREIDNKLSDIDSDVFD